ncbi:MAG: DUF2252 domain-containing protein [Acidimicrobiia bacterium]
MAQIDEQYARGKKLRQQVPRSSHATFNRSPEVDPVKVLTDQDEGRIPSLVPERHARMGENPFSFYRAGAKLMATDLSGTPTTDIVTQLSGDAHLSNFGWYGSPERRLVFDTNDFDETLPGPFEWDVKRMAASFVIAAQNSGFDAKDQEAAASRAVQSYRDAMLQYASQGYLDVWYMGLSADRVYDILRDQGQKKRAKHLKKKSKKARGKNSEHVLKKLGKVVDGEYQIKADPPWVIPASSMQQDMEPGALRHRVTYTIDRYQHTISDEMKVLVGRYKLLDAALKVVGVGSVGTRCYIVLLQGRDQQDPLFLQIKQAADSALADFLPPSQYAHPGERVVQGQRLMQTSTDIFLGWVDGEHGTKYYVRQLKDMKASVEVEDLDPKGLQTYATACASVLAQAHARAGHAAVMSGYMGSGDVFADAVTEFSVKYAEQNDADYEAFAKEVGFGSESDPGSVS